MSEQSADAATAEETSVHVATSTIDWDDLLVPACRTFCGCAPLRSA